LAVHQVLPKDGLEEFALSAAESVPVDIGPVLSFPRGQGMRSFGNGIAQYAS